MKKLMLIDASDPAETRVVVTKDDRVEEFDREIRSHAQIKGNIYLAKVTRVEPSLQAAFVDYGGNRHGFLPFSEIHPDYYRIPVADREALLAEEAAIKAAAEEEDEDDEDEDDLSQRRVAKKARRSTAARPDATDDATDDAIEASPPATEEASGDSEDTEVEEAADSGQSPETVAIDQPEEADESASADASEPAEAEQVSEVGADAPEESTAAAAAEEGAPESEPVAGPEEVPESESSEDTPIPDGSGSERSLPMVAKSGDKITGTPEEAAAAEAEQAKLEVEAPAEEEQTAEPAESDEAAVDEPEPQTGPSEDEVAQSTEPADEPPSAEPLASTEAQAKPTLDLEAPETIDEPQASADPSPEPDPSEGEPEAEATAVEPEPATDAESAAESPAEAEASVDEMAPTEAAPTEAAPTEAAPTEAAPTEAAPESTGEGEAADASQASAGEEAAAPPAKEASSSRSSRRSRSRRSGRRSSRSRSNGSEPPQEVQAVEVDDEPSGRDAIEEVEQEIQVDTLDGDDIEDAARRRAKLLRRYKIQEVIKRGQIMLVQVAKEERGNKGAALTTYLSLPGRYCVLMPNTARGGGISRKIGSSSDRKRLKQVLGELSIPEGMAVIVRTAGSERSKTEIRRDYDYLIRLWGEIRESTLQAQAPALIYEEGNIVKRAIRDLYTSDMSEILVDGEEGYKAAKAFMRNLMPSHARKVQLFKDGGQPLLQQHRIEHQLASMFLPEVQLRSGGYLVINVTEALVAIDVNSGKATRERHIEETALKTNLEAAEEVARQLRLRDLAGLIVIDFIDMEENRHNRDVERRLKDAMKADRARIQLGRISPFGLLELSRQRLRPSLVETAMITCQHCSGTGRLYSAETAAMALLRAVAEEGGRRHGGEMVVTVPSSVALYLLNHKRAQMAREEERFGFSLRIEIDDSLSELQHRIERIGGTRRAPPRAERSETSKSEQKPAKVREEPEEQDAPAQQAEAEEDDEDQEDDRGQKRRRRRGKRGGRRRSRRPEDELAAAETEGQEGAEESPTESDEAAAQQEAASDAQPGQDAPSGAVDDQVADLDATVAEATVPGEASLPNGQGRADEPLVDQGPEPVEEEPAVQAEPVILEPAPEVELPLEIEAEPEAVEDAEEPEEDKAEPSFDVVTAPDPSQPKRRGWWNRLVR